MIFESGRIVLAPFKFTDMDIYRVRPVLVVSRPNFCDATGNFVAAMITTARKSSWPLDVEIDEWESVGLTTPCVVRMKLFTIVTEAVRDRMGGLGDANLERVERSLTTLFFDQTPA